MASPAQMDRNRRGLNFSNRPRSSSSAKKGAFARSPAPTNINRPGQNDISPRPSFLSDLGSKSGAKPNRVFDYGSQYKDSMAADLDAMLNKAQGTGVTAFNAPGGSGGNEPYNATMAAQTMLGDDYYNKALKFMSPQQLNDQIAKAQGYGRGINLSQFKADLDKFDAFQSGGGKPMNIDDTTYLSVSDPLMTANAPTLAQLMGDIGGGIGDMFGAGADFIMGGGTLGNIISGLKDKFSQGKEFVKDFTNPMDIQGKLAAADSEVRRKYALYLSQGMPYQQAYQMATGQELMARGGISNLN